MPVQAIDLNHCHPAETQRWVDDMNQRIVRQQKRIERILVSREGPAEEMHAVLADMIKARDRMLGQINKGSTSLLRSRARRVQAIANQVEPRKR